MKLRAITAISMLALLLTTTGASAARTRHATPTKCAPRSHILFADAQAVVYTVRERLVIPSVGGGHEVQTVIATRGCVYGHRGSYELGVEYVPAGTEDNGYSRNYVLAGSTVAYEEFFTTVTRYAREGEATMTSWRVIVRDLRTGRVLHNVPTGMPLKPESGTIGVGNVVALVLKSDGSVAWIAEDYGRSAVVPPTPEGTTPPYFDVYAADKSGTRLLASGTNINPSSLALSVAATNLDAYPHTIAGSAVYWTQGGKPFSASLN